jgi:predicted transcriptional regulator
MTFWKGANPVSAPAMEKPDLYVLIRIMERLRKANEPMLRTPLQVACNLNYDVFCKYLEWMSFKGLVTFEQTDGREGIRLSPKGEAAYARMVSWMNEFISGR